MRLRRGRLLSVLSADEVRGCLGRWSRGWSDWFLSLLVNREDRESEVQPIAEGLRMNIIWVMWSATTWPDQLARKLWSNQTCRFSFWEYPWNGSIFHGYSVWFVQLPKELNPQFHPSPGSANLSGLSFDGRWYRLHRAGRSHHWQCGLPVHPGARWVHQSTPPQLDAEWIFCLWLAGRALPQSLYSLWDSKSFLELSWSTCSF